ncbi:DEAD/DEAH box helicase [Chungangia koreensis]|uniref:DEAD/DEAH box helicase n=1 Tax=Chungangia koreensis TaxID=752657 RepID=A0ABV8X370_9LACT
MKKELQEFLTGRIWLRDHTPFPQDLINDHIENNLLTTIDGIYQKKTKFIHTYTCMRCRNTDRRFFAMFDCAKCEGPCVYCRHCIRMGRVSSCTKLIKWNGPSPEIKQDHSFAWDGQLTSAQQKAANELSENIQLERPHLIHAVCGAGKTEILFKPIHELLQEGKRVCVAAPRTDVVLELTPRFRQVFPETIIHSLYGGAEFQEGFAQLVIATTHQLYRFEGAFDAVFVDEADAFPYSADETLRRAVEKAKKPDTPVYVVTATPSNELIRNVKQSGGRISVITKRFHGHPLPVPRFDSLWNYGKQIHKGRIPSKLRDWTAERLANEEPFLIFFPTIELMEKAEPLFQQIHRGIHAVHADVPDRKEKVLSLRNKEVPGLLTTTILERGITIPRVQVAVVGADEGIFTESALIQIGGRVGRSKDDPTGDLVFFHHGITYAMDDAKREIERLNRAKEVHI